jgi:hypothetical protein
MRADDARPAGPPWIGEVAAIVAHELGNATTALTFALDLLAERPLAAGDRDELRALLDRASALIRLLARLTSRGTAPAAIDLRAVVTDAEPVLARFAGRRLAVTVPPQAVRVVVERAALESALVEIVRALGAGSGAVGIEVGADGALRVEASGATPPEAASLPYARDFAAAHDAPFACRATPSGDAMAVLAIPLARA